MGDVGSGGLEEHFSSSLCSHPYQRLNNHVFHFDCNGIFALTGYYKVMKPNFVNFHMVIALKLDHFHFLIFYTGKLVALILVHKERRVGQDELAETTAMSSLLTH